MNQLIRLLLSLNIEKAAGRDHTAAAEKHRELR